MADGGVWIKVHPDDAGCGNGTLDPAVLLSDPVAVSNATAPTAYTVKLTDGSQKKIWLLKGNTTVARSIDVEEDESVDTTEVRTKAPQPQSVYSVELGPGSLYGILVGSGGAGGGSAHGSAYFGGAGGAGGVTGTGAHVPVILPSEAAATYTITVGSTMPGSDLGSPAMSPGTPTTIAVEGQEPFHAALGGGRGWCHQSGVSMPAGDGASGGGGFGSNPIGANNSTVGTPGQGNAGGPMSGSTGGGGGGYGSAGKAAWAGGDGFNLRAALQLDDSDSNTASFLADVSDNGFIAGGGSSNNGEPGPGGGRGQNSASGGNAQDFTGSGGGNTGPGGMAGNGAAGMVLLVTEV